MRILYSFYKKKFFFLLLCFLPLSLSAQTPQGGQFTVFGDFPLSFRQSFFGVYLNPASIQEYERFTLSGIYGTLDKETLVGIGLGFPTIRGTMGFHILYQKQEQGLDKLLGSSFFYSREIAEELYFGLGVKFFSLSGYQDKGLLFNGDMGLFYQLPIQEKMTRFGLSLVNVGLPQKLGDKDSYPPLGFRLESQMDFEFLEEEEWKTKPFVSLFFAIYPMGNLISIGVEQQISFLNIGLGTSLETFGKNYEKMGALFVSLKAQKQFEEFGIQGQYTLYPIADFNNNGKKEQKHLFSLQMEIGQTDKKGPTIQIHPLSLIQKDNTIYLSPNEDNINDYLVFGLEIEDISGLQEWRFIVKNERGDVVYDRGVTITKTKVGWSASKNIFKAKEMAFYPSEIIWPGIDQKGQKLPDGIYYFSVQAKDFKGNVSLLANPDGSQKQKVVIDTQKPEINVLIADKNFSPNNDGNKDFLKIEHKNPSEEALWYMEIQSNGNPVFRKRWENKPEETILWDGKNEDGVLLPDGQYQYVLTAIDKAGNTSKKIISGIILDTKSLVVKAKAKDNYFSPNGDGIKDNIEIDQEVNKEADWTGEIVNEKNEIVRKWEWKGRPAKTLRWDGKDNAGKTQPDGKYVYRLKGIDKAGNKTEEELASFFIDNTKPVAKMAVKDKYFSPNNDGKKDLLEILFSAVSEEDFWKLELRNNKNEVVRSFHWQGLPPEKILFNGLNQENQRLEDGEYSLVLKSEDRAGNSFETVVDAIVLDTKEPTITLQSEYDLFSPNNDGRKDTVKIQFQVEGGENIQLVIKNEKNETILEKQLPVETKDWIWDGKDNQGKTVKDGTYSILLKSKDKAENEASQEITVSALTIEGNIFLSSNRRIINPLNEKFANMIFQAEIPAKELVEKIEIQILDKENEVLQTERRENVKDTRLEISFSGRVKNRVLKDGQYGKKLIVSYKNGDIKESNTVFFTVDTTGPVAFLSLDKEIFSPDEDGENDTLGISLKADDVSGIESWTIVIEDRFKETFKTFQGKREIPSLIEWDGKANNGELTDSAEDFFIYAIITDGVGNTTTTSKIPFSTDILVIKTDRGYKIRISNIEFDLNKADLKPSGLKILDKVAEKLKKFPTYRLKIEGHADSTGLESWNEKLSFLRAESVKNYLVEEKKLRAERFTTEGFGSRIPLYPNNTAKNRAKNRRVEILLIR